MKFLQRLQRAKSTRFDFTSGNPFDYKIRQGGRTEGVPSKAANSRRGSGTLLKRDLPEERLVVQHLKKQGTAPLSRPRQKQREDESGGFLRLLASFPIIYLLRKVGPQDLSEETE